MGSDYYAEETAEERDLRLARMHAGPNFEWQGQWYAKARFVLAFDLDADGDLVVGRRPGVAADCPQTDPEPDDIEERVQRYLGYMRQARRNVREADSAGGRLL